MDDIPAFAPLTAALIRRRRDAPCVEEPARPGVERRSDLRLFAFAWAAGFVFFLIFLA